METVNRRNKIMLFHSLTICYIINFASKNNPQAHLHISISHSIWVVYMYRCHPQKHFTHNQAESSRFAWTCLFMSRQSVIGHARHVLSPKNSSFIWGDLDPHDPHLRHGSLGLHESTMQTGSWSVQPFLHSSHQSIFRLARHVLSPKSCSFVRGSAPPSNTHLSPNPKQHLDRFRFLWSYVSAVCSNSSFWNQRSWWNSNGVSPNVGAKYRWGRLNRWFSINISSYLINSIR